MRKCSTPRSRATIAVAAAVALIAGARPVEAQTYTLPFDPDVGSGHVDSTSEIPSTYGTVAGKVAVTSRTHTEFGDHPYAPEPGLCYWHASYGDLTGVAYSCARAAGVSEFAFQPVSGYRLFLESLTVGEYLGRVPGEATVKVFTWDYATELFSASMALGASEHWDVAFTGLSSEEGLRLQYGNNWDYGGDDITFRLERTAASTVPEPMSLALLATGLAGLVAIRRGRKAGPREA